MTRSSQVQPQIQPMMRLAAAVLTAFAVLPLSGCLYAQIPVNVPDGDGPDPSPTTEASEEPGGGIPSTMTFDDGADLPATAYIQWGDGLMTDDGWKSVKPDDGNGGWTYGTVDDTCTAQFWQGQISDVPTVPGDDSVSSDAMLAVILGDATAADITPVATTSAFTYQVGGSAEVENRRLVGDAGERQWIMAGRAFATTGVGLYVIVDCIGGDVEATMDEVVEKNSILITE